MELPSTISAAVDVFSRLPGVGSKSSLRHILNMTNWTPEEVNVFASSIRSLASLKYCKSCGFFAEALECNICSNEARIENKTLCVIEHVQDLMAIENSQQFDGLYFVLGGVLNPLLGIGPNDLRLDSLKNVIQEKAIEKIILAINPSVEGDATCSYIHSLMNENILVERIGFGIPMGGNLEYLDPLTISKALENRKSL